MSKNVPSFWHAWQGRPWCSFPIHHSHIITQGLCTSKACMSLTIVKIRSLKILVWQNNFLSKQVALAPYVPGTWPLLKFWIEILLRLDAQFCRFLLSRFEIQKVMPMTSIYPTYEYCTTSIWVRSILNVREKWYVSIWLLRKTQMKLMWSENGIFEMCTNLFRT